ncbi:MAG: acyl-CoA dehydrogenase family protein [Proteobacteria bacterium]|nr:acyl-CoA dehydrogenase family protein [Pseudomonadota bacterium]
MSRTLNADEAAACDSIRRVCADVLAPAAAEVDETSSFPQAQLAALAELGVWGLNLPDAWGGPGLSAMALAAGVEAVAGSCASTASALTAHYLATDAILIGGDDDLRRRFLPEAATGRKLGAFALTEPRAGSNPADMRCRAVREGHSYHLSGTKHFISNGGIADFIVVFAVTDPTAAHKGISAFVVEKGMGFTASPPEKTMGLKGGHVFELNFDTQVPEANRIGAEGSGFRTAMKVLDNGRVEVSAMCLGIAQAALDAATHWAGERQVGGMPLAEYQGIQWMIADMATQLRAARLLTQDAAAKRASGVRFSLEAAMAKLFASETAGKVADLALQIHGGYGYTRGLPLERHARDLRIMRIYEGSSEIQRTIIARHLLQTH